MSQSAEAKLHELRSKTNRELVSLISNKLDRGLALARVLESGGGNDWISADHFAENAEKALMEAARWMTLLNGTTVRERRQIEFKFAQLRAALERMHASVMRVSATC